MRVGGPRVRPRRWILLLSLSIVASALAAALAASGALRAPPGASSLGGGGGGLAGAGPRRSLLQYVFDIGSYDTQFDHKTMRRKRPPRTPATTTTPPRPAATTTPPRPPAMATPTQTVEASKKKSPAASNKSSPKQVPPRNGRGGAPNSKSSPPAGTGVAAAFDRQLGSRTDLSDADKEYLRRLSPGVKAQLMKRQSARYGPGDERYAENGRKYHFISPTYPANGTIIEGDGAWPRRYANSTFEFPLGVAEARADPQCKTVFERASDALGAKFAGQGGVSLYKRFKSFMGADASRRKGSVTPAPIGGKGGLIWFRHVHKTGGSTFRHLIHSMSDWTHSFYAPMREHVEQFFANFTAAASAPGHEGPPKFMVEAHDGYSVTADGTKKNAALLRDARKAFGARGWDCPISIVFIRDPLPLYISLYRWAIVGNTKNNMDKFWWGGNFTDWMPDNVLSRLLYDPTRFFDRRFLQKRWWNGGEDPSKTVLNRGEMVNLFPHKDPYLSPLSMAVADPKYVFDESTHGNLTAALDEFDIVAPLSHFDHVVALLSLAFDWDEMPMYLPDKPTRPNECYRCLGVETDEDICPDMDDCRRHVERKAPYDYLVFNRYKARFLQQLQYLGPEFELYVDTYLAELDRRRAGVEKVKLRSKTNIVTFREYDEASQRQITTSNEFGFYCNNINITTVGDERVVTTIGAGLDCLDAAYHKLRGEEIPREIIDRRGYKDLKRTFSGR